MPITNDCRFTYSLCMAVLRFMEMASLWCSAKPFCQTMSRYTPEQEPRPDHFQFDLIEINVGWQVTFWQVTNRVFYLPTCYNSLPTFENMKISYWHFSCYPLSSQDTTCHCQKFPRALNCCHAIWIRNCIIWTWLLKKENATFELKCLMYCTPPDVDRFVISINFVEYERAWNC